MKDLVKGNTTTIILALLKSEPMYGYQIVKELNERHMDVMQMNQGTIYPLLHSLERQDLVASEVKKAGKLRTRKYYRLTASGEKALTGSIRQWRSFSSALDSLIRRPA